MFASAAKLTHLFLYVCPFPAVEEAPPQPGSARTKLVDRQVERLRKAAEKSEQIRAQIEKRKQEWEEL